MASRKTSFERPAEGVRAFKATNPTLFNRAFDKWKQQEGPMEILGRASHEGVELIYWRKKARS